MDANLDAQQIGGRRNAISTMYTCAECTKLKG